MSSPPTVSVIVPVYNSEMYVEECVRSLLGQTLDGLEIIVVDDGSTDRSIDIVRSLAVPPGKRLRVLHKPNGGLSSARNFGVAASTGRWIGLVDSDDFAHPEMYRRLAECAEQDQADLAICSGCVVDHDTKKSGPFRDAELWTVLLNGKKRLFDPAATPNLFVLDTQAGRRLYRRSFLSAVGFRFAEGFLFEDVLASYQLLFRTRRVALVEGPFYCYREGHPGRITSRKDAQILQVLEIMQGVAAELAVHGASAEIWANFMRFQNWVLLWLCNQIEPAHRLEFAVRACKLARQFPRDAIHVFWRRFAGDARVQEGVFLQLLGRPEAYRAYADYEGMTERARRLFARRWPRWLLLARAPRRSRACMPVELLHTVNGRGAAVVEVSSSGAGRVANRPDDGIAKAARRDPRLSFVLTLSLSDTGRPGNDLERASILMDSCVRFVDPRDLGAFAIITPARHLADVRRGLAAYARRLPLVFIDEAEVSPALSSDPDTSSKWPRDNKGWYRQQLIKLAAHAFVPTPFYMTLDSDVVFKRAFRSERVIVGEKSVVNVENHELYRSLYVPKTADFERDLRLERYADAARVLKLSRPAERMMLWYGETPVILSRVVAQRLAEHVGHVWQKPWQDALLQNLPWTEYPLYFVFAEATGAFAEFHVPGEAHSISNLAQSLWLETHHYRDGRNLLTWPVDEVFHADSPGFTVVVQSYLGHEPGDVRQRIGRFIAPSPSVPA